MNIFTTLFLFFFLTITATLQAQYSLEWANNTGGTGYEHGYAVSTDTAGNVYTTGYFEGTVDFDPSMATFNLTVDGGRDVFIQKLDASGNFIWAKSMGGFSNDRPYDIVVDVAGNVYTTGQFRGTVDFDPGAAVFNLTPTGADDIFIQKLDVNGDFVWAKNMGQVGSNNGDAISVDANGNVYIAGSFQGTVDFDPGAGTTNLTAISGDYDTFFLKLDANGNFVWAKRMGNASRDVVNAIEVDASGNLYTTGSFFGTVDFDPGTGTQTMATTGVSVETYIQKLDSNGDLIWVKQLKSSNSYNRPYGLSLDASGNVYTTGIFADTMDVDPSAAVLNLAPNGLADAFIHKMDANGNFIWAKQVGQTGYAEGRAADIDAQGNIYTIGFFNDSIDLDPSSTTTLHGITNGRQDIFVQKLDSMGEFVWAHTMGGSGSDYGRDLSVSPSGDIYLAGYFFDTMTVALGPTTITLNGQGLSDVFVLKFAAPVTTNITALPALVNALTLFPNPAKEQVQLLGLEGAFQGQLLNVMGRKIRAINATTIQVGDLAPGIYYLQLQTGNQQYVERFIKS